MKSGTKVFLATVAACLVCLPMQAQMNGHSPAAQAANDPTRNGMSAEQTSANTDELFLKKAAGGNMTEVAMGKMALQKTSNEDVKAFAQKMVDDHTAMESDVEAVAKGMNVTLPTGLPKSEQKPMAKMEALNGDAFDKAYAAGMVKDHKKVLSEFRGEISTTQNAQVKELATKGADTIAHHLKMAEDMQAKVGKP
jgi:putative membrane protein